MLIAVDVQGHGLAQDRDGPVTARNLLFHPFGSLPAEGPGSEGVQHFRAG
jgi:hypothetical protein